MTTKTKSRLNPSENGHAAPAAPAAPEVVKLTIPEVQMQMVRVRVRGLSPLVIRAWDQKTAQQLEDKAKGKKASRSREPVDPDAVFNGARYISTEGWDGVPASAFKASLVEAVSCYDLPKTEFSMKLAKKCLFVLPEGIDRLSGRDLIRINGSEPEVYKLMQPTSGGGPYMSYRPIYRQWWCRVVVRFNALKIDAQGVLNLLAMAGECVGVGEHRPSSKESCTGVFGRWEVLPDDESSE